MLTRRVCSLCGEVGADRRGSLCWGCRADLPVRQDPARCPCGGAPRASACPRCLSRALAFDDCVAACAYRYPVDLMIKKIKYQGRLDLIPPLADLLAERIDFTNMAMPECLLPVPLHAARFRQRGFNQAGEIARALARRLPAPVAQGRARRHRATAQQHALSPAQRRVNVRGAFSISKSISYNRIALIDDVVTTGATVGELARLLKRNGVEQVQVWSLAQAVPSR